MEFPNLFFIFASLKQIKMIIQTEDFLIDYGNLNELSYYETGSDYIDLYKGDEFMGYLTVYVDRENDNREYLCINYEVVYLDNIEKIN